MQSLNKRVILFRVSRHVDPLLQVSIFSNGLDHKIIACTVS